MYVFVRLWRAHMARCIQHTMNKKKSIAIPLGCLVLDCREWKWCEWCYLSEAVLDLSSPWRYPRTSLEGSVKRTVKCIQVNQFSNGCVYFYVWMWRSIAHVHFLDVFSSFSSHITTISHLFNSSNFSYIEHYVSGVNRNGTNTLRFFSFSEHIFCNFIPLHPFACTFFFRLVVLLFLLLSPLMWYLPGSVLFALFSR